MKRPEKNRPVLPDRLTPHRKLLDERGVSPVIGTILMVAITVVLAATLYVLVLTLIGDGGSIPTGAMHFDETNPQNGVYRGGLISISEVEELRHYSITIIDTSTDNSAILDPLTDGGIASCREGELNISYRDLNGNEKLDPADIFTVYNGGEGDIIKLSHTKGQICSVKLS